MDDRDREHPPAPTRPAGAPPEPDRAPAEEDDPPKVGLEDVSRLSPEHAPDDEG